MKASFKAWLKQVDKILMNRIGLTHADCRDRGFYDAWENGESATEFVDSEWGEGDFEDMMSEELFG